MGVTLLARASALLVATLSLQSIAASPDVSDDQLKNLLNGMGSLNFSRLTSRTEFRGCELNYRQVFRDFRGHNGELVAIFGSVSSNYVVGKTFNLLLKTRAALVSPRTGQMTVIQPAFAALSLQTPLSRFKTVEFKCEDDGICIGYGDNNKLELMSLTFDRWFNPGPEITVTLKPNGLDQVIVLKDILNSPSPDKAESAKAFFAFYDCLSEVIKGMVDQLKKPPTSK